MKTLDDHVILYDSECPLCDLYTKTFVATGMLGKEGRTAFSKASNVIASYNIDRNRACDEIALVNKKTGKIEYGIESLFHILSHRFPYLKILFANTAFRLMLARCYAFISYNRKVIIPGKIVNNRNACTPTFNFKYRAAYILGTWLITSFILATYAERLFPLIPATNFYREFLICGGQIIFQGIIIAIIDRKKLFDYLGNMMTISFVASLLLALAMTMNFTPILAAIVFATIVFMMFIEHLRRMRMLELPYVMTVSWVVYRIIVLSVLVQ